MKKLSANSLLLALSPLLALVPAVAAANGPPVARADEEFIHNNGIRYFSVLENDDVPDRDDSNYLSGPIEDPNHPLDDHATVAKEGSRIRYRPDSGFVGTDTFRYRINDGELFHSAVVTVVVAANRAPVADRDSATTDRGQSILIDVLEGDFDPDHDPLILAGPIEDSQNPLSDHATVVKEGSRIRYTPFPDFVGTDTFRYRISDGALLHSAVVTVTVVDPTVPACTAPSITRNPESKEVGQGAQVEFGVAATGTPPLAYQWRRDEHTLVGATAADLIILSAQHLVHAGTYRVEVSNACGSALSNPARLVVHCTGPGDHLQVLSDRLVGRALYCTRAPDSYKPTFPVAYSTSEFNTPPLTAAFELIDNPGRIEVGADGKPGDVLKWWLDYLDGELGTFPRGPSSPWNWHLGAQEALSGVYQQYNLNAVLAVHFHARKKWREGGGEGPRYELIAKKARAWLRANFAILAAAAVPRPRSVAGQEYTQTINADIESYIALAGPRYRYKSWNNRLRSMIFQRAVAEITSTGEPGYQRRLLDHIEQGWGPIRNPNPPAPPLDHSVYGLTAGDRAALWGIQGSHALPSSFVETYLGGIRLLKPYEIVAWPDGTRVTFMERPANFFKAPTFAKIRVPGDDRLYAVYPFRTGEHAVPPCCGHHATLDLAEGTIVGHGPTVTERFPFPGVRPLPPYCQASFHLDLNEQGVALRPIPSCAAATAGCPPPAAAGLLGHWAFEQASNLGLDGSGAGRDAAEIGDVVPAAGRAGGGGAAAFGGTGFLHIPGLGAALGQRSQVTVSAWVRVPLHVQPNVFRVGQPVALHSDRFSVANYAAGGWSTVVADPPPPVGSWYHLAGVFDQGTLRIYVDGQLAGSAAAGFAETGDAVADGSIGARALGAASGDQFFVGEIDDVRVYARVLSEEEIAGGVCP